ncbi:hypothetical protein PGQ11_010229 [Apiospora arundinis]|uniref:PD-(D/E)XK nuclease-like domain-containing protein n=1 Tax=Apiospora arundinis TaxID=335852 RepID=A0ABR2I978_9PEZI
MAQKRGLIDWLDAIEPIDENEYPAPKRARRCSTLLRSPPLTTDNESVSMSDASRGRKRGDGEAAQPRPIFPMPKRPKSSSPKKTKTKSQLEELAKPFHMRGFPSHTQAPTRLPSDVRALYEHLFRAKNRMHIIPFELREQLRTEYVSEASVKPCCPEEDQDLHAKAATILARLYSIGQKAMEASVYARHESAWNSFVHGPMLDLVFASNILGTDSMFSDDLQLPLRRNASVRYEQVTGASITSDALPMRSGTDTGSFYSPSLAGTSVDYQSDITMSKIDNRGDSKRVDYVLVMDMPETAPLQREISRIAAEIGCCGTSHFNQTLYRAVARSLIAVSIETKAELPQYDPLLQLGIWASAWHKRMYDLRGAIDPEGPCPRLVTMPLIQAVGHKWEIYFASDLGNAIDLFGPMAIGGTEDLVSMYALLASLQAIKDWVETTFQDSMTAWFMIREDGEEERPSDSPADG